MRDKKGLLIHEVEEQAIVRAVCDKVGVEQLDKVFKNIFDNDMVLKAMHRKNSLEQVLVDENELHILSDGFEKVTRKLGESHLTYYTRECFTVLKKQFIFVDRIEVSINPEGESLSQMQNEAH